jgi:hypothetical protein
MDEVISRKINIDQVTKGDKMLKLEDGRVKYTLWKLKKDGTPTKAFEQWEQYELDQGMAVTAGIKEEEKSFENEKGDTILFTQRTILYFEGDEYGTPNVAIQSKEVDMEGLIATAIEAHERDFHAKDGAKEDLPY